MIAFDLCLIEFTDVARPFLLFRTSIIYFKLAEITNGNELKNSKYGQNTGKKLPNFQTTYRLQMVSKICYSWQGERKRFNLIPYMLIILI